MQLEHRDHEDRPWGSFDRFTLNEQTTIKILIARPNQTLSLQYHNHRSEFWRVLKGSGTVVIDETEQPAKEGDEFFIPQGAHHRIKTGNEEIQWLEIASGEFDEEDIVRLEDSYGRT